MRRRVVSALLASLWMAAAVQAQLPKITYVSPLGLPPGETVDLTLVGDNLAKPARLWTTLPVTHALADASSGNTPKNGTDAKRVTYRTSVPKDILPAIYALRLTTGHGVSNLRLVMIDDLPTVSESSTNKSAAQAQPLELPVAVEGSAEPESYDFYKFHAVAGQRLTAEVMARRLGTPLDAVLRLLDEQGRELAYSDDEEGSGADSRFAYRFAKTGDYYLELRDIRYQGGADYRYRLRLGDFPLATAAFPLAVEQGATGQIEVTGPAADRVEPIAVTAARPSARASDRIFVRLANPGGQGISSIEVLRSAGPEQVEFEPNDTPAAASPVLASGAVNGRFAKKGDRDYFRFQAKKGEQLAAAGQTRSLGSPTDLYMRLYDAQGKQLAEVEDSGADEGSLSYKFAADGEYRLEVEDLLRRGGPDYVYRIEFQKDQPAFTLAADADVFNPPRGGVFKTKITAVRRAYKGPIELAVQTEDTNHPFKLSGATIPANKLLTTLVVQVPAELEPGTPLRISIIGRATGEKPPIEARVLCTAALRTALSGLSNLPWGCDGWFHLGIGQPTPPFIKLAVDPSPLVVPQVLGTATVKVKATRLDKFDGPIELAVESLPPSFQLKPAKIDKGKTEVALELAIPPATAAGDYPLRLVGTGENKDQPGKVELDVAVRVRPPLALKVPESLELVAGKGGKLRIEAARTAQPASDIELAVSGLPGSVQVKAGKIAAGATAGEIELVVGPKTVGKTYRCRATATTKIKDQSVAIESGPIELKIVDAKDDRRSASSEPAARRKP